MSKSFESMSVAERHAHQQALDALVKSYRVSHAAGKLNASQEKRMADAEQAADAWRRQMSQPERRQVPARPANNSGGISREVHHDIEFPFARKSTVFRSAEDAHNTGLWLKGVVLGDARARRQYEERTGIELRSHIEGANSSGGALVPDGFEASIIDLRDQHGVFRANARVVNMSGETLTRPRTTAGLTAYFVGEENEVTESTKSFDSIKLTARKLAILAKMSSELEEDSAVPVVEDLTRDAALQFAYKEDLCGFIGDGGSTYGGVTGIVNRLDNSNLAGFVDATAGEDTLPEITAGSLAKLMGELPLYARSGAKWYASPAVCDGVLTRLMIAGGGNTVSDMAAGVPLRFMGFPVVQVPVMASTFSDGDIVLLFGDLMQSSTMGTRRDIRVQRLSERYAEYDQVGLLVTERFDIVNHDYGDTSTAGPIVALAMNTA